MGIFVVQVHGLSEQPCPPSPSLGVRPTVDDSGRVLPETHILDQQVDAYGKVIHVEFLKKLRDEEKYIDLANAHRGHQQRCRTSEALFSTTHRLSD